MSKRSIIAAIATIAIVSLFAALFSLWGRGVVVAALLSLAFIMIVFGLADSFESIRKRYEDE